MSLASGLPRRRGETILVVDDEDAIRAVVVRSLEREGLDVREASDGFAALEAIEQDRPDVLLLDVAMPGLSGLEVLDRIGQRPELTSMPVILLTGRATHDDLVTGMRRGAYDFLTKPFRPAELTARVRAALRTVELVGRLERRNVELDRFAATAAHDLKSPLTIIRGASQLLRTRWDRLSEDLRTEQFASIGQAAIRASQMIDNLLELSRFDAHGGSSAVIPDPRGIADAVVAAAPLRPDDDVQVDGTWAPVTAAAADLQSALSNLVDNACHYGRSADGVLHARITSRVDPTAVVIEVSDAGPGIADAERPKVFDPFYAPAGSRDVNPASSGVGLAIVTRAAERWGGSAECVSAPTGTTFRLTLPPVTAEPGAAA
ncbi:MAG: two-component system, sensor histidine kinase and response regulator [Frankiaceae bacterium]|jgi:signal transduction histidine kinase|nr:two-component system, sensor histidine kinase and response regulator [Frankiaceae bacterium]